MKMRLKGLLADSHDIRTLSPRIAHMYMDALLTLIFPPCPDDGVYPLYRWSMESNTALQHSRLWIYLLKEFLVAVKN